MKVKLTVTVAVLAISSALLTGCGHKGLTASSSCKDYMHASQSDRDSAVEKIASDEHAVNAVTPLGRPNIDYMCAGAPGMTLGDVIQRTG